MRHFIKMLGVFIIYLLTEPFVQIGKLLKGIWTKGQILNYPRTWQAIFFVLMIFFYLAKNIFMTNIFIILLVITIIYTEWTIGPWKERYRKTIREKIEEKIKRQLEEEKKYAPSVKKKEEIKATAEALRSKTYKPKEEKKNE